MREESATETLRLLKPKDILELLEVTENGEARHVAENREAEKEQEKEQAGMEEREEKEEKEEKEEQEKEAVEMEAPKHKEVKGLESVSRVKCRTEDGVEGWVTLSHLRQGAHLFKVMVSSRLTDAFEMAEPQQAEQAEGTLRPGDVVEVLEWPKEAAGCRRMYVKTRGGQCGWITESKDGKIFAEVL